MAINKTRRNRRFGTLARKGALAAFAVGGPVSQDQIDRYGRIKTYLETNPTDEDLSAAQDTYGVSNEELAAARAYGSVPAQSVPPAPISTTPAPPTEEYAAGQYYNPFSLPQNFDYQRYIDANKDLSSAGIDTEVEAMRHYYLYGQKEGRNINAAGPKTYQDLSEQDRKNSIAAYRKTTGFGGILNDPELVDIQKNYFSQGQFQTDYSSAKPADTFEYLNTMGTSNRPVDQLSSIKTAWEANKDKPSEMRRLMEEYGVTLGDLSQATGETFSQLNNWVKNGDLLGTIGFSVNRPGAYDKFKATTTAKYDPNATTVAGPSTAASREADYRSSQQRAANTFDPLAYEKYKQFVTAGMQPEEAFKQAGLKSQYYAPDGYVNPTKPAPAFGRVQQYQAPQAQSQAQKFSTLESTVLAGAPTTPSALSRGQQNLFTPQTGPALPSPVAGAPTALSASITTPATAPTTTPSSSRLKPKELRDLIESGPRTQEALNTAFATYTPAELSAAFPELGDEEQFAKAAKEAAKGNVVSASASTANKNTFAPDEQERPDQAMAVSNVAVNNDKQEKSKPQSAERYLDLNPDLRRDFESKKAADPALTPDAYASNHYLAYGYGENRPGTEYFKESTDRLTDQILKQGTTSQWKGDGFGGPEANAQGMARILSSIGITDIKDFGKIDKYEEAAVQTGPDGKPVYGRNTNTIIDPGGENSGTIYGDFFTPLEDQSTVTFRDGKPIVVSGSSYGNKVTGQAVPNTYSERQTGNAFGGTFKGDGNTGFRVIFENDKPIFYTTGATSNDLAILLEDPLIGALAQAAAGYFGGPLGTAALNLAMGKDLEDVAKATFLSYVGGKVGAGVAGSESVVGTLGTTGAQVAGNIASQFVKTGDLEAAIISGGLGAGVNFMSEKIPGFSDLPKFAQDAFKAGVRAELTGKDVTDAVVNSAINSGLQAAKLGMSSSNGGITRRIKDEAIPQGEAGVDTFIAAKNAGATDEEAMDAAEAVTGDSLNAPAGLQLASAEQETVSDAGDAPFRAEVQGMPIYVGDPRESKVSVPFGYQMMTYAEGDADTLPEGSYYDILQNAWFKPSDEVQQLNEGNFVDDDEYFSQIGINSFSPNRASPSNQEILDDIGYKAPDNLGELVITDKKEPITDFGELVITDKKEPITDFGELVITDTRPKPETTPPTPTPPAPAVPATPTPAAPASPAVTQLRQQLGMPSIGGSLGIQKSPFDSDALRSTETQKKIDPLARVKQAQAELERDIMMSNIDPRLLSVMQQRNLPEQQANQFNSDIGALSKVLSGDSDAGNYYSYGSESSVDKILSGKAYKEGGFVEPLRASGAMALPLMAKSGGSLGKYEGREDFKDGKHVAGEGDGQSDDIPAWLADGEFVFSSDVVAALGNGSTKAGTDKLYEMMHAIRERARSTGPKDLPPPALKSPLDYLKSTKRSAR